MTGKLIVLTGGLVDGTGESFEWKDRVLDVHTYTCRTKLIVELDPDMTDALTYAFTTEVLSGVRDTLVLTTEELQRWNALPTLRKTTSGKTLPLPIHADLIHNPNQTNQTVEAGVS